ncbi:MAG: hypothetical protein KatS3mg092_0777 [Patescibacteria group bacterium]|nr:MAG: hypothetical protein KatS3mg092_0777 [Patescibacteria group bacterium]
MKGYKIHIKRIEETSGEIIRTIKYPLQNINKNNIEIENQLFSNLINDDKKTRGISNIIDFYQENENYNLFDFWIDSLKAGIIFQPTSKYLIDFVKKIRNEKSIADEIFENSSEEIKKYFKKREFIKNIIISDPKRSNSSKNGFFNTLFESIKDEYKDLKNKRIVDQNLEKIIKTIIDSFYDDKDKLLLESGEKQNNFWKKQFNIDKDLLSSKEKTKIGELTNFILPELINIKNNQVTLEELINQRIKLAESYLQKINLNLNNKYEITKSLLGLENNFNALSNYLNIFFNFLIEEKIDDIIDAYLKITTLNEQEKELVKESLFYLSKKTKNLGKPKFINSNWQDYRSIFGGKIQSWYSNYVNRLTKSKENYNLFIKTLENTIDYLNKNINLNIDENKEKIEIDILNRINYLKDICLKNKDIFENVEKFQIFSDYLAEIKTLVNLYFQKYLKKNDDDKINQNKIFGFLFKKIEKPINFYGYSKKQFLSKIIKTTSLKIKDGYIIIKKLLNEINNLKDKDYKKAIEEILEIFFEKISRKTITSAFFFNEYKKIFKKYIDEKEDLKRIFNHSDYYAFYKNPREKQNKKIIQIKKDIKIKDLLYDFYNLINSINYEYLIKNPLLFLEYLETAKSLISIFIQNNVNNKFKINKNEFLNYEKINHFIELQKKEDFTNDEFNKIINQYFFSELKGALNIYSKKVEVNKYNLQIIKSQEKFPIILEFPQQLTIDDLINKNKELINLSHKYFVVFDQNFSFKKIKNNNEKTNHFFINKNEIIPIKIINLKKELIYFINSSFYQTQFLDRLIYKPKNWENIKITISEPSFILEIKNCINFDIFNEKIDFKEKNRQLFISVPFNITSKQNISTNKMENKKNLYMGIDAGEYGVAYCLVDFSEKKTKNFRNRLYKKQKYKKNQRLLS